MNFIEKSIAAVFPAWGAHRAENRYLIAQYEGALATQGVPAKKAKDNISKDVERSQLELAQVARHQNKMTHCLPLLSMRWLRNHRGRSDYSPTAKK